MKLLHIVNLRNPGDKGFGEYGLIDREDVSDSGSLGLWYSHVCSNHDFAIGDLVSDKPSRILELKDKYGTSFEVRDMNGYTYHFGEI